MKIEIQKTTEFVTDVVYDVAIKEITETANRRETAGRKVKGLKRGRHASLTAT